MNVMHSGLSVSQDGMADRSTMLPYCTTSAVALQRSPPGRLYKGITVARQPPRNAIASYRRHRSTPHGKKRHIHNP